MAKKFISDFQVNEVVDSCFIMSKKELKLTKYDKPYLHITLADKTGKIEARLWDDAEKFNQAAEAGDVVRVKGTVDKYREEKQFKIDILEKADDRMYRYEDMVRVAENREDIFNEVVGLLYTIEDPWIKKLKERFTGDEGLMRFFRDGMGGKMWHNAYIGGLMEHTREVMRIVDAMSIMYPEADRDIMLFGAFIHDIGKVHELDVKKTEYTVEGGLVGHIVIGHKMLMEKINSIEGFPEELSMLLEHIILSHHGEYEQQSPVLPKTLEATIVYHADELTSQANAIKEIGRSQSAEGKVWSNFVSIKNRKYYIKERSGELPPAAKKFEEELEKEPGASDEDLFGF
ncbi:MAG: HD domain-containing protein [Candidatus Omnitrophica bacterium]|nr:HD domain-containing protein [Candidatus Omnitrophota bacterium]